jgi:hypothetical protein
MPVKVIGISIANGKPAMAIAETTTNRMGFQLSGFKGVYPCRAGKRT